ncbi:MAG: LamG domain-containing protein, partial [Proteiniphilum sp.]
PHEGNPANAQNNRTAGIRIFRENAGGKQRVKANIGNGTADSWLDGGTKADLDPATAGWVHIALVLSPDKASFFMAGVEVAATNFTGISWNGCDIMSIGSGAPRFNEWGHLSDLSLIDEVRIYNKALPASEIERLAAQ